MANERHYLFPPFRLDPLNEQLWRDEKEIILRRKTFEVLHYLLDNQGRLVTKAALLDAVWGGIAVSDSLPAVCVGELRKALGDSTRTHSLSRRCMAEAIALLRALRLSPFRGLALDQFWSLRNGGQSWLAGRSNSGECLSGMPKRSPLGDK